MQLNQNCPVWAKRSNFLSLSRRGPPTSGNSLGDPDLPPWRRLRTLGREGGGRTQTALPSFRPSFSPLTVGVAHLLPPSDANGSARISRAQKLCWSPKVPA